VIEIISHVHSPNLLRDFYWQLDHSLHFYLVKPGGDYAQLLDRAEEEHMKQLMNVGRGGCPTHRWRRGRRQPSRARFCLLCWFAACFLQRIRTERAQAREEAEDQGLGR
jgi:hypothetical protein